MLYYYIWKISYILYRNKAKIKQFSFHIKSEKKYQTGEKNGETNTEEM